MERAEFVPIVRVRIVTAWLLFSKIIFGAKGEVFEPAVKYMKVKVESHGRNYESGPVAGTYALSVHNQVIFSIDKPPCGEIWQWAMLTGDGKGDNNCELSMIYGGLGYEAVFYCGRVEGVYHVYAKTLPISELPPGIKENYNKYFVKSGHNLCEDASMNCLEPFMMVSKAELQENPDLLENLILVESMGNKMVKSDPIKLQPSEYCFLWGYALEAVKRVGYVQKDISTDTEDGTYILYKLYLYVVAPNMMTEEEIVHKLPHGANQKMATKLLTQRFHAKGLEPCLRRTHPAVELVSPPEFQSNSYGSYWIMSIKVHTDTVVASLSDISFTVASRQHMALYGCFIEETRIMVSPREFSFLKPQAYQKHSINFDHTVLPETTKLLVSTRLKEIYGRPVKVVGRPWEAESMLHRRDAQAFVNPCVTREFGLVVRGNAYLIQNWFQADEDIHPIVLPDVVEPDMVERRGMNYEKVPIKVFDVVWTPTHLAILLDKSRVVLHPSSVVSKGFGMVPEAHSYQVGALVSRRWCARTGTPKEHNMIVPAFSLTGNLIIIQILPTESTTTMWIPAATDSCLIQRPIKKVSTDPHGKSGLKIPTKTNINDQEDSDNPDKKSRFAKDSPTLEECIHLKEVQVTDSHDLDTTAEKERLDKECKKYMDDPAADTQVSQDKLDAMLTFWSSGQALITENDPHFTSKMNQGTLKQLNPDSEHYNKYVLYEADVNGEKIAKVLEENDLTVKEVSYKFGTRKLFWLHDVQFSAIERNYLLAVEFKSDTIKGVSFAMTVLNVVTLNHPIRISRTESRVQQLNTNYVFTGVLIVRPIKDGDSQAQDKLKGRINLYTTNSAKTSYVLHLDYGLGKNSKDMMFYATLDGGHARPLTYKDLDAGSDETSAVEKTDFAGTHPLVNRPDEGILKADMVMTEHGLVSVLWRKANTTDKEGQPEDKDEFPQAAIIGSVLVTDPLAKVMPFKGTDYMFQRITADDEIVYGEYMLEEWETLTSKDPSGCKVKKARKGRSSGNETGQQTHLSKARRLKVQESLEDSSQALSEESSELEDLVDTKPSPPSNDPLSNLADQLNFFITLQNKLFGTRGSATEETLSGTGSTSPMTSEQVTTKSVSSIADSTAENQVSALKNVTTTPKAWSRSTPPMNVGTGVDMTTKRTTIKNSQSPLTILASTSTSDGSRASKTTFSASPTTKASTPPPSAATTSSKLTSTTSSSSHGQTSRFTVPQSSIVKSISSSTITTVRKKPARQSTSSMAVSNVSGILLSTPSPKSSTTHRSSSSVTPTNTQSKLLSNNTTAATTTPSKKPTTTKTRATRTKPNTTRSSKSTKPTPKTVSTSKIRTTSPAVSVSPTVKPPKFEYSPPRKKDLVVKQTRISSTPYAALLGGTVEAIAAASDDNSTYYGTQDICPYADFRVHFIPFDFAEVDYRTRISAEIVYLGNAIPLEADIIVEFDDLPGVSVQLSTSTEENRDQTLVRKIIDIQTHLTDEGLERMKKYAFEHGDTEDVEEAVRVFSITMRPSILNMRCPTDSLFKTIQINVGCNPFSSMRFAGEAIGLKKVPYIASSSNADREIHWTMSKEGDDYILTIPRNKVNFEQRKLFDCKKTEHGKPGYCIVPKDLTRLFKDNIYSIHFTKKIVPKFEQILTRHVRKVTGNVFLYNILSGKIQTNITMLKAGCPNIASICAATDEACLAAQNNSETASSKPWTASFFQSAKTLSPKTDIYKYFHDCFNSKRVNDEGDVFWMPRNLPKRLDSENYWLFNSTNFNALSLSKHRNMIFLIRAVVINTDDNRFTFCQRLDTFFALYMTGVAPTRQPLPWGLYLIITVFVLAAMLLLYVLYRNSHYWRSEDFARRLREEEYREKREADAIRLKMNADVPANYGIWAARHRNLTLLSHQNLDMKKKFS